MAGAAIWLTAVGATFASVSLAMIGTPSALAVLIAFLVATAILIGRAVAVIRRNLRLPGPIAPRTPEERAMLRPFLIVLIAEIVALMVVNPICAIAQRLDLIVPLDVLIVGLHFFPLARIFHVRRYHWLGAAFCGMTLLTLTVVPASLQIGNAGARFVLPALGCAPAAFVIGALNAREARRSLREWQEAALPV